MLLLSPFLPSSQAAGGLLCVLYVLHIWERGERGEERERERGGGGGGRGQFSERKGNDGIYIAGGHAKNMMVVLVKYTNTEGSPKWNCTEKKELS